MSYDLLDCMTAAWLDANLPYEDIDFRAEWDAEIDTDDWAMRQWMIEVYNPCLDVPGGGSEEFNARSEFWDVFCDCRGTYAGHQWGCTAPSLLGHDVEVWCSANWKGTEPPDY